MPKLIKALRTIAYEGIVVNQGDVVPMDEEHIEAFGSEYVRVVDHPDMPEVSDTLPDGSNPEEEETEPSNDEPF
jgi:hypothetical protein